MAGSTSYGFSSLPIARQVGLLVGLAASGALIAWLALMIWEPDYTSLYSGLEAKDTTAVVAALQAATIPYKLDQATGAVLVPPSRVHEARLKLASQGLPKGTGVGVESLQEEQSFGTSQFVESARYHHAMETELARTIGTMRNVKSVRVHLAIPKRSVFVRTRENPSASVALNLYGGRTIEQGQVNAIMHLVASSISNLSTENITVVDQTGRLLSSGGMDSNAAMTAKQYEYNRQVESDYVSRIEHLLEPIVGAGKVRATVNADIDFTEEESTEELFSPNQNSVRSEQASESISRSAAQAEGIPGALSNQPPAGGVLVEGAGSVAADAMDGAQAGNSSKNSVRNYELDKTIRHKRQGTGIVKRLSVGVLIDDQVKLAQGGNEQRTPWTDDEIKRFTTLIEQTIGFDQQRGDRVNIINASFSPEVALEELPEPGLMEQAWIRNLGKQLLAGTIILILIFTVLRPTAKKLANYQPPAPLLAGPGGGAEGAGGSMGQLEHKSAAIPLPGAEDRKVEFARSMVDHDAGRVANVVKDWLGNEAS